MMRLSDSPSFSSKRNVAFGIAELLVQRVAVDDVQRLADAGIARPFRCVADHARGAAEDGQELRGDLRIRQLQRSSARREARECRRHAEYLRHRVEHHLSRQAGG